MSRNQDGQNHLGRERVGKLAKLATPKGREEAGLILLDSRLLVEEGLAAGLVVEIVADQDNLARVAKLAPPTVRLTLASAADLARIAHVEQSPGILAIARPPRPADLREFSKHPQLFGLYLDRLADPGNVGTLARSAAALGVDLLILAPGTADPLNPKALRASAGALLRLPTYREQSTGEAATTVGPAIYYRAVPRGGQNPLLTKNAPRRILWLGSEAHGPTAPIQNLTISDLTIPMSTSVESLNVAAAGAILLFLLSR